MNELETQDPQEVGKADMRGLINVVGIEQAAVKVADRWAPPFDPEAEARLRGFILAAFEAGMLHQLNTGVKR